ncbi:MAG: flagellar type III secretion system pore protein FliP [Rhodospirillales bacterium]|nr:flagellar type III secretion system pore protein FliP [Rhodospirillales bacterium]
MSRLFRILLPALLILAPLPAMAQNFSLDLGDGTSTTGRIVQLLLLMTVLSLAPSILMMVTSFVRIVVVLSLLRTALGTQQAPPNAVLTSLALFLTFFIMAPVGETAWRDGISPLIDGRITEAQSIERTAKPFHDFMIGHTREQDLGLFIDIAKIPAPETPEATPYRVLIPAFMISELRRAFEIGFLLFIPFVIIDMVVAAVLMSMGMMMMPPAIVSLPFKLIFFVLVDGWYLISGSLVQSFGSG